MLTASSPPQLTIVAGTDAAASIAGSMAARSESWIGLYTLGALTCTGIGWPSRMASMWAAGHPPLGPYGTFRRVMVVGRLSCLAQNRTTASVAILQMLYVWMKSQMRWLSP